MRGITLLGAVLVTVTAAVSADRPDREDETQTTVGQALFVRAAAERNRWRAHLIVWRGADFQARGRRSELSVSHCGRHRRSGHP